MSQVMILGNPVNSNQWEMGNREASWVAVEGEDLKIEFQFRFPVIEGSTGVPVVESLLALSVHDHSSIRFMLDLAESKVDVFLSVWSKNGEKRTNLGVLGKIPQPVSLFLSQAWAKIEEVQSDKFNVELSSVRESVPTSRFFSVAEEVDYLTEAEYSEMMKSIQESLGQTIYNVKIGLKVSKIQKKKDARVLLGKV